ncbi:MAG: branched-chain amino acid aminotransferase [Thermomicrobiales bacterium]
MDQPIAINPTDVSRRGDLNVSQTPFGTVFSDHMLIARWRDGQWREVGIEPYGPIPMPPSINGLQYGLCVFEGLKAFRTVAGSVALFRPRENFLRLGRSCQRLALPEVPEGLFFEGLKQLMALDQAWVPSPDEGSLYIRPCVFATDENVRVKAASSALFVIFACPVGAYYAEPLSLLAETRYTRAFPGGTGDVKPGGNYAVSLLAEREAQERGYHNVLWLDGREHRYVEEAGVMNIFFVIDGIVVTPNLSGTILAGVTRDSVIALLADMDIPVEERPIAMDEIVAAYDHGALRECFGTGTAATVAPIGKIGYQTRELVLPPVADWKIGPAVLARITHLRTGRADDPRGWLVPV